MVLDGANQLRDFLNAKPFPNDDPILIQLQNQIIRAESYLAADAPQTGSAQQATLDNRNVESELAKADLSSSVLGVSWDFSFTSILRQSMRLPELIVFISNKLLQLMDRRALGDDTHQ